MATFFVFSTQSSLGDTRSKRLTQPEKVRDDSRWKSIRISKMGVKAVKELQSTSCVQARRASGCTLRRLLFAGKQPSAQSSGDHKLRRPWHFTSFVSMRSETGQSRSCRTVCMRLRQAPHSEKLHNPASLRPWFKESKLNSSPDSSPCLVPACFWMTRKGYSRCTASFQQSEAVIQTRDCDASAANRSENCQLPVPGLQMSSCDDSIQDERM